MTDPEFSGFLTLLYCQYPSLREWLQQHSPDPDRTQRMWAAALRSYSIEECQVVLCQWAEMSDSPLKAYSRDFVANLIRSTADRNRDKRRLAEQRQQSIDQSVEYTDSQGRVIASNMTSTLDRMLEWRREVNAGQLDQQAADLFIRKALSEVA